MTGIKINYTCVHTDNYQGGSGAVINETMIKLIPEDTMIQMVKEFAVNNVLAHQNKNGFPKESFQIVSIELIEIFE